MELSDTTIATAFVANEMEGDMATAKPERHLNIGSVCVQVSSRRQKDSVVGHNKSTIQLSKFLYRSPQLAGGDMSVGLWVPFQGIKNQRAGPRHHRICVADCKQRPDPATFSTLAGYFDSQFQERFEYFFTAV